MSRWRAGLRIGEALALTGSLGVAPGAAVRSPGGGRFYGRCGGPIRGVFRGPATPR
jgi:hypothetical protein